MRKAGRWTAACNGAWKGAMTGAWMGICALVVAALLLALSADFRRERPDLRVSVLAVIYLAGGTLAGAAAGALRVYLPGRSGRMAIGVLLTAVGYASTYSLINREPFTLDRAHMFGLFFTSILLGALLGLTRGGSRP